VKLAELEENLKGKDAEITDLEEMIRDKDKLIE
jgi:hypothetical protein